MVLILNTIAIILILCSIMVRDQNFQFHSYPLRHSSPRPQKAYFPHFLLSLPTKPGFSSLYTNCTDRSTVFTRTAHTQSPAVRAPLLQLPSHTPDARLLLSCTLQDGISLLELFYFPTMVQGFLSPSVSYIFQELSHSIY